MFSLRLCILLIGLHAALADVCYQELGCFELTDDFTSIIRFISVDPDSPGDIGTIFNLFTPKNESEEVSAVDVVESNKTFDAFNPELDTKIIVHGFLENPKPGQIFESSWLLEMKKELLKVQDYNVIIVDWSRGNIPPYTKATANTRVVGRQIGHLISNLVSKHPELLSEEAFHILGHSLGSHIAGYAGEYLRKRSEKGLGKPLGRITGLDPAGPYFENTAPAVRLDETDASFVDAIHTDGFNIFGLTAMGMLQPSGHVDFYPNGGHHQPGCSLSDIDFFEDGLSEGVSNLVACSHWRSYDLYIKSIDPKSCQFEAIPCVSESQFNGLTCSDCPSEGCNIMGYHVKNSTQPKWYLKTNTSEPNCGPLMRMKIKLGDESGTSEKQGQIFVKVKGDKGETGVIPITSDVAPHKPGTSKSKMFAHATDIGVPITIELTWKHKPSFFSFLGSEDEHLDVEFIELIKLTNGVSEGFKFTTTESPLKSDQTATFVKVV